jgi:hypothetical protein
MKDELGSMRDRPARKESSRPVLSLHGALDMSRELLGDHVDLRRGQGARGGAKQPSCFGSAKSEKGRGRLAGTVASA